MSTSKKIEQSETVIIKRSQINFASYNPKRHSEEAIKKQKKNFKDVGFLGGVIWNSLTGNLVSGHKRVMALDMVYGNSLDNPTDYDVKVEKVEFTEKQEKEQNIYMDSRSNNTFQAYDLLAVVLPEIDYKLAGLDNNELALITLQSPFIKTGRAEEIKDDFKKLGAEMTAKKEAVKQVKADMKREISTSHSAAYVTLSFDSMENKSQFLAMYGFDPNLTIIKGESFHELINNEK